MLMHTDKIDFSWTFPIV